MSENRFIGVVVTVGIGIAIVVTGGIIYAKKSKDEAERQRHVALVNDLGTAITRANELSKTWEFKDAANTLAVMQPRISSTDAPELAGQLQRAIADVTEAEREYRDKIERGYTIFQGKLVSSEQKERMLAKQHRKAEGDRRRKEEERRLAAERKRRAEWYVGGTLAKASALEWQVATVDNKLATCGDFVAAMWKSESFVPRIQKSITCVDDMKPYAQELVEFLDAATEKHADPEQNRRMYANQTVASCSAIGMRMMRWLK